MRKRGHFTGKLLSVILAVTLAFSSTAVSSLAAENSQLLLEQTAADEDAYAASDDAEVEADKGSEYILESDSASSDDETQESENDPVLDSETEISEEPQEDAPFDDELESEELEDAESVDPTLPEDEEEDEDGASTVKKGSKLFGTTAEGDCGGNAHYVLDDDGTLTISGSGEMNDYGGGSAPWHKNNKNDVKKVVIESGITKIGNAAFYDLPNLNEAIISDSVINIGGAAFESTAITSVVIPQYVTTIGTKAFRNCSKLETVNIESAVISSREEHIFDGAKIKNLILSSNMRYIPGNLFSYATFNDANITIPENVSEVKNGAFHGASGISELNYEDGSKLLTIGTSAFEDVLLETVTIPAGVKEIGMYAFSGNTAVKEVTIPENVTKIQTAAFSACKNLTKVDIKSIKLTTVEGSVFYGCNLSDVSLADMTEIPENLFKQANFALGTIITIPATVEKIGDNAFYVTNMQGISGVVFAEGSVLREIGKYAFANTSISSIVFPSSLEVILQTAFQKTQLTSLIIPENLTTMGSDAFTNCSSLSSVEVRTNKLTEYTYDVVYGAHVFKGCAIRNISFSPEVTKIPDALFKDATLSGCNLVIPKTVKEIGVKAFASTEGGLASLTFEEGSQLTSIGGEAFYNTSIYELNLPESLTVLSQGAFSQTQISKVRIPSNVTTLGDKVFSNCKYLTEVEFATRNLTSVGTKVFENCPLEKIIFAEGFITIPANLFSGATLSDCNIVIPSTVTSIGANAFAGIDSGTFSLTFADGSTITTIGSGAFKNSAITGIDLPASVTTIEDEAFYGSRLTKIVIPENVTNIGIRAFYNCRQLTEVEIKSTKLQDFKDSYQLFLGAVIKKVVLPDGMIRIPSCLFCSVQFDKCEVVIPKSVQIVGQQAFYSLNTESAISGLTFEEGSALTTIEMGAFYGANITELVLPEGIKLIGPSAFNSSKVSSVTFPSSLERIGAEAFEKTNLNSITLPAGLITIGDHAFNGTAIAMVELPSTILSVGEYAFRTSVFTKATIPAGVNKLGVGAFYNTSYDGVSNKVKLYVVNGSYAYKWAQEENTFLNNIYEIITASSINYVLNGGVNNPENPGVYEKGAAITLKDPTYDGYRFAGWYDNAKFSGNPVTVVDTSKDKNLTFYAKWVSKGYLVFFDANGGTDGTLTLGEMDIADFTEEELKGLGVDTSKMDLSKGYLQALAFDEVMELTGDEFTKNGQKLVKWTNSKTKKSTVLTSIKGLTNKPELIILTADWGNGTYKITYNLNGGAYAKGAVKGRTSYTADSEDFNLPEAKDLVRAGYIFKGWFDTKNPSDDATPYTTAGGAICEDLNLYAVWEPYTYTLWLDGNDGTLITGSVVEKELSYTDTFALTKAYERVGYTLSGWNTKKDGTGKKYGVTATVKGLAATYTTEPIVLYAQWKPVASKITYELDGGKQTKAPTSYQPNKDTTLAIPVKAGYSFTGWTVSMKDGTSPVTANYVETKDGSGTVIACSLAQEVISSGVLTTPNYGDIILKANWQEGSYKVVVNVNSSDLKDPSKATVTSDSIAYSGTVDLNYLAVQAEALVKDDALSGKSISSFNTKADGKGKKYALGFATKLTTDESLQLYAIWATKTCHIVYDIGGVTTTKLPVSYTAGKKVKVPAAARLGYVFDGWKVLENGNYVAVEEATAHDFTPDKNGAFFINAGNSADIFLKAQWKPLSYTVEIDPNGKDVLVYGTTAGAIAVKYDANYDTDAIVTNQIFERPGYTFAGYCASKNGKGKMLEEVSRAGSLINYSLAAAATKAGTVKYYAIWIANRYNIAYDAAGGVTYNARTNFHGKALKLSNPTRTGYTFLGWKLNGSHAGKNISVTYKKGTDYVTQINAANVDDISLIATWRENEYKLKVTSNGGVKKSDKKKDGGVLVPYTYTADASAEVTSRAVLYEKKGFAFAGFGLDTKGTRMLTDATGKLLPSSPYVSGGKLSGLSTKDKASVTVYAIWEKVETATPKIKNISRGGTNITVSYTRENSAAETKYEVKYATSILFRGADSVVVGNVGTADIKGTAAGKIYYVRVRQIKTDSTGNAVYGKWSWVKKAAKPIT